MNKEWQLREYEAMGFTLATAEECAGHFNRGAVPRSIFLKVQWKHLFAMNTTAEKDVEAHVAHIMTLIMKKMGEKASHEVWHLIYLKIIVFIRFVVYLFRFNNYFKTGS